MTEVQLVTGVLQKRKVSASYDSLVQGSSEDLHLNFFLKIPAFSNAKTVMPNSITTVQNNE